MSEHSELSSREHDLLGEMGHRLEEYLPSLTTAWQRTLEGLLATAEQPARKEARRESVQAAYAILRALAEGQPDAAWKAGRAYGETAALQGLSHTLMGQWLIALRQSLLTSLSQTYADDPRLDQAIIAFSKFFATYMFRVTESFSGRQQRLLLEQQEALRQAYEQAQRRIVELEVLNEIGQAISSTMELDDLLELVYQQTSRLMDTTSFYIALCDWEQGLVHFPVQFENGEREPPGSQAITAGLTGHIVRTGRPLHCPHGPDEFLKEQGIGRVGRPSVSWLGVPMTVQDRVVGVIAVQSYTQPGAYDAGHLRVLSTIASQAGVAVENARLYSEARRRAEEMEALYRIGATGALHLGVEEILQSVYEQAGVVMDTSAFFVALYDRENEEITFALDYERGERSEPFRAKKSEKGGLTGWVLDHRESLLISDWQRAPEELREIGIAVGEPARSWLGVPMVVHGEVIGVIATQSYEPGAFDEHDRQVLEMIAHQAAATIESARLYQDAQRRVAELSGLQQVGLKLAATTDLSEVLDAVAESTMDLLHPGDVLIFLYNATQDAFTLASGLRDTGERGLFAPKPHRDGLTATVARSGELTIIEDVPNHPLYMRDSEQTQELKSIASVPLIRVGEVLGVLNVSYHRQHHFTAEEVRLIQALADQAAVAIGNTRLFRRTQAVMQELQETTETQSQLLHLIQDLSTPVVPLTEGVLLMPLVGSIDSARGRQILERLLKVVEKEETQVVLLDITGVPVVDTAVAQILLQAVQAVQLLGGEAVLVGIRPEVAQTLIGLGVSLAGITTRANLQGGLAYAMRRAGRRYRAGQHTPRRVQA